MIVKTHAGHVINLMIKKHKCVDASTLNRWLHFLVDNIWLSFGKDAVLHQEIGIPMGANCAFFVANLLCFAYEYDFIVQLVSANWVNIFLSSLVMRVT